MKLTPTAKSIADDLGLAKSTVSMALRNNPTVSMQTRQRVQDAARRMNYFPNAIAQAMSTGKAKVIGFVSHSISNEHLATILEGSIVSAERLGYFVKVIQVEWEFDVPSIISQCQAQCLSGLIFGETSRSNIVQLAKLMRNIDLPIVQVAGDDHLSKLTNICCDDQLGIYQAVEHLVHFGHTRIGFIGGDSKTASAKIREQGYEKAMLAFELKTYTQDKQSGGYRTIPTQRATRTILGQITRPTALICANDQTAMIAIRTAREMGLQTPLDISVIGFSNLQMAEFCDPPLTSIHQPKKQMGQLAVEQIIQCIQNKKKAKNEMPDQHSPKQLETQLIIRDSTGPVKE